MHVTPLELRFKKDKLLKPRCVLLDVDTECSRDKTTLGINDVNLSDSDSVSDPIDLISVTYFHLRLF